MSAPPKVSRELQDAVQGMLADAEEHAERRESLDAKIAARLDDDFFDDDFRAHHEYDSDGDDSEHDDDFEEFKVLPPGKKAKRDRGG